MALCTTPKEPVPSCTFWTKYSSSKTRRCFEELFDENDEARFTVTGKGGSGPLSDTEDERLFFELFPPMRMGYKTCTLNHICMENSTNREDICEITEEKLFPYNKKMITSFSSVHRSPIICSLFPASGNREEVPTTREPV